MSGMKINGYEAHALLFAFDAYYQTDVHGRVGPCSDSVRPMLQSLRDRLMVAHDHPHDEDIEE